MMSMTTLLVVCLCFIALNTKNYALAAGAATPYNSLKQTCCNGNVQDTVTGQPACCGPNIYDALTQQCCDDGSTVIPLMDGNQALTCCGGKPVVVGYNQMCCAGVLSDRPRAITPSDTFACCDTSIYVQQRESCCAGIVSPDPDQVLGCCNDEISYDTTTQICCESFLVLDVPDDAVTFAYGCCGEDVFDSTVEICDVFTDTIFLKPANASCPDTYWQVCGGEILNPNEQCCNNESFVAPTVWIDDGTGTGNGYMSQIATCCANGQTILEDPRTEACCSDPKVGVLPIDLPSQTCCANQIMDTTVNTCCDDTIQPGPTFSMSCCSRTSYSYLNELCCGDTVYETSDGYDACCIAYD